MATDSGTAQTVEIVCTAGEIPFLATGSIRSEDSGVYTIDVDRDTSALQAGARIILSYPDGQSDRIVAVVNQAEGNELVCSLQQLRQRERREFPRLHGGVPVRYRRVPAADFTSIANRWLAGSNDADVLGSESEWVEPGRFMNYSVTGLRFNTPDVIPLQEVILLEFGVPDRADRWRCTARCVFSGDNPDGNDRIVAIEFVQISGEAREALTNMTLEAQSMLLD